MNIYFINWTASYEIRMIDYLAQHYPVSRVTTPAILNWLSKKFKRIIFIKKILASIFIRLYLPNLKADDVILYNDSHVLKRLNPEIIKLLRCRRILLLRNPVNDDFIQRMKHIFDDVYGFEDQVCQNNGIKYTPQFFPVGFRERNVYTTPNESASHRKCYFVGRDKGRLSAIVDLANKLRDVNCEIKFHLVRDNSSTEQSDLYIDESITYEQNLLNSRNTDCIVDITQEGQTGWTLRVLEALYFNKKLITNNLSLYGTDIYSADRVFIIGHDSWEKFEEFLAADLKPISDDILYQYSPDYMIEKIIDNINKYDYL